MQVGTLANSLWEENKFWVLARSRNLYDDIATAVADKTYDQTYRLLELASAIPEYNFQYSADQVWGCLQEIVGEKERQEWDVLEEIGDILTKKEFLWHLILRYRVTYLLNCRLFFDINPFDRFLFAAGSQKKLYLWNRIRVMEIDVQHLIKKSGRLHDPNYLLTILVNGHPYPNPKLETR
ncbi:MAG: hypothetical protein ACE5H0_01145 [Bacteroidota bacterium]